MEPITRPKAYELLNANKETSNFFNRTFDVDEFCTMCKSAGFGDADVRIMLASLRIVGAKFKKKEKEKRYGKIQRRNG